MEEDYKQKTDKSVEAIIKMMSNRLSADDQQRIRDAYAFAARPIRTRNASRVSHTLSIPYPWRASLPKSSSWVPTQS